ncbi:MAG TPA: heme-binding domain-containing protein [Chitinophagales bacterium]|nr:heme-binding domain-containing protein [Chitinophagales bacterium]HNL85401.1 heme-binding domain-containing protein [Chitinophagales bacterium]
MKKKILYVLLAVFIVIQFFHPKKNISAQVADYSYMPADVQTIVKKSCFDCHSNNTAYPWYNNIQPVAWWLNRHIVEGKEKLNFDDFQNSKKKDDIAESIEKGEMPLSSYTLIHRDAIMNDQQKQIVINWAKQFEHEKGGNQERGEENEH